MAGSSELTPGVGVLNGKVTVVGKAVSDTADLYVDLSTRDGSKVVFFVDRDASAKNPTIKVTDGGSTEFTAGAVGDYTFATTASGSYFMGPFETARFKDTDSYINVRDSSASTAVVTVYALLLP